MSTARPSAARPSWRLAVFLILLLLPAALPAATDPVYTELRNARPDGRTVPVSGLVLERDAFKFQFDSGTFHFLKPAGGRTVGAVFVGHGSYRLSPATENERRQLALSSGADPKGFETLSDDFDDLVLLFADDTAQEIEIHAPARIGAPDARAVEIYERYLKQQRKDFRINFHVRLLKDLLNHWFFNQWVYGVDVPHYTQDLKVEAAGEETRIHGTIRQEGVSKDFRALVPIYVEFDKNATARVGMLPLIGESSVPVDVKLKLPRKARKALLNAHGEILARD